MSSHEELLSHSCNHCVKNPGILVMRDHTNDLSQSVWKNCLWYKLAYASLDRSLMTMLGLTPLSSPDSVWLWKNGTGHFDSSDSFEWIVPSLDESQSAYSLDKKSHMNLFSKDTSSTDSFNTVRKWISECGSKHGPCNTKDRNVESLEGIRFLRIYDHALKLEESPTPARYACLSHCWGDGQNLLQTTQENRRIHVFSGIPIETLPKTYRDSVVVCKELGIDYLWIDSLCIVQNNEQDWNQQALRMADVYQNAYITIAAVAARNSEEGLFNDISDRRISYPLPDHPWVHVRRRIRVPSRKPQFMDMLSDDGFPLYKRGWVFQELSLSPRVIHYGREELIWHCRANSRYEGVPKGFYNLPTLVRADLRGFSTQLMWHKIVASFSWRKLTFEKDRLPAIAAFATLIQPQDCEKRYIHGLWEETLRSDLLWSVDTYGAGQNTLGCRSNRLPSWSWTSTARPVQWCNTPYLDNCQEIPYTKIKEILYSTRGPVILGDARQATIVIQAPILRLCDIKFVRYSCDLIENLHHGLGWSAPQWDTPIDAEIYGKQDTKALAIPLLSMKRNVVRRDVCQYRNALLIAETSEIGKYKRLGVVTIDVDNDVDFETAVLDSRKGLSVDEKATRATARTERYDRFMQVLGEMETHTITLL